MNWSCPSLMPHPRVCLTGGCSTSRERVSVITVIILITLPQLSATVTRRQSCTMPNTSICKLGVSRHRTQLETRDGGRWWNIETCADVNNDPDGDNYPFTMSSSLLVLTSCKNINLIWCGSSYLFWNIANILNWSLGHFQPKVDQPVQLYIY